MKPIIRQEKEEYRHANLVQDYIHNSKTTQLIIITKLMQFRAIQYFRLDENDDCFTLIFYRFYEVIIVIKMFDVIYRKYFIVIHGPKCMFEGLINT